MKKGFNEKKELPVLNVFVPNEKKLQLLKKTKSKKIELEQNMEGFKFHFFISNNRLKLEWIEFFADFTKK